MSHHAFYKPRHTREQAVRSLRRAVSRVRDWDDQPEPRPSLAWCRPPARPTMDGAVAGCESALRLHDGRVFVGLVVSVGPTIAIRPWGRRRAVRFARAAVVSVSVVQAHAWRDRQRVLRRQRDGLPAFVVGKEESDELL